MCTNTRSELHCACRRVLYIHMIATVPEVQGDSVYSENQREHKLCLEYWQESVPPLLANPPPPANLFYKNLDKMGIILWSWNHYYFSVSKTQANVPKRKKMCFD